VTIEDPYVIDSVTEANDGSSFALLMTEERPFEQDETQVAQLLEKINTYVGYLQSGQFHVDFPRARNRPVTVVLVCWDEPTDRYVDLIRAGAALFANHGAAFRVDIIPAGLLPGRRD
jgi:hypothetical protein